MHVILTLAATRCPAAWLYSIDSLSTRCAQTGRLASEIEHPRHRWRVVACRRIGELNNLCALQEITQVEQRTTHRTGMSRPNRIDAVERVDIRRRASKRQPRRPRLGRVVATNQPIHPVPPNISTHCLSLCSHILDPTCARSMTSQPHLEQSLKTTMNFNSATAMD